MKRIFVIALLLCATACSAATVTFEWDLSADDASLGPAGGYRLYQSKTSGSNDSPPVATVGAGINTVTIKVPAGKYYWVVTAFSEETESDYSNEVSAVIRPAGPRNFRITVAK